MVRSGAGAVSWAAVLVLVGQVLAAGAIEVTAPWARATATGQTVGAAYLTIHDGGQGDRLVGVESPAAAMVHLHGTTIDADGVMRMQMPLDATLEVPAGGTVTLVPGVMHLMLMGLREPLVEGRSLPLTLHFEKAGAVAVEAVVAGPGAKGPP